MDLLHPTLHLPVTLRRFVAEDAHEDGTLDALSNGYDTPIWGEPTYNRFLAHLIAAHPIRETLSIHWEGRPVGIYGFLPFPDEGPAAVETLLYLHPDYRRRGIANLLLRSSAQTAAFHHIPLFSDVSTDNPGSLALHQALFPRTPLTLGHRSPLGYTTNRWLLSAAPDQDLPYSHRWIKEDLGWALGRLTRAMTQNAPLERTR